MQLAEDGNNIILHYYQNKTKADRLKKKLQKIGSGVRVVSGDITVRKDVEKIREHAQRAFGSIPVVVNCSTLKVPNIKFSDLEWCDIEKHFNINIKGAFNLIKSFRRDWENNSFGKFIGLTTLYTEKPQPELLNYITSKTALNGFSKALACELAPKGIRINLVSPGMVDTDLVADIPEKVKLLSAAQTPLRTLASASDVAGVICFLASNKANYLTGETIRVNGGQIML